MARANYLSQDRSDIRFAVKELSRRMSQPTVADRWALNRLARYLVGREARSYQDIPAGRMDEEL